MTRSTLPAEVVAEPWRFDLLGLMRHMERLHAEKPRIGDSVRTADEALRLSQDPYLEFPAANIAAATVDERERLRLTVQFLGMFGPQGALPLSVTEETFGWLVVRDDAFPRFVDLFQQRFLQLFFRAWADARPIAQHDRPEADRFLAYIGSMIGIGTPPYRDADSLPDYAKLEFAGLLGPRAKSGTRLRQFIAGLFDVTVEVEEFIGTWLTFEASETTKLGRNQCGLGTDALLGASMFSLQDKFRLRIFVQDFEQYQRFLPVGDHAEKLADAVYLHVGDEIDWDIELAIPAGEILPVRLGSGGRLGWTTWMAPNWSQTDRAYRTDTRFHLAERFAHRRKAKD